MYVSADYSNMTVQLLIAVGVAVVAYAVYAIWKKKKKNKGDGEAK